MDSTTLSPTVPPLPTEHTVLALATWIHQAGLPEPTEISNWGYTWQLTLPTLDDFAAWMRALGYTTAYYRGTGQHDHYAAHGDHRGYARLHYHDLSTRSGTPFAELTLDDITDRVTAIQHAQDRAAGADQ